MNDKKIEILLDSFEKLKSKINDPDDDYVRSIETTISKLLEMDKELSVEIWEYCLSEFKNYNDYYGNHMFFYSGVSFRALFENLWHKKHIKLA